MADSKVLLLFLSLLTLSCNSSHSLQNSSSTNSLDTSRLISIKSTCQTTPYPETCFETLKLSISITIGPKVLNYLLQTLDSAISEAGRVSTLLSTAGQGNNLVEKQRGTIQDCVDLHRITLDSLHRSASRLRDPNPDKRKISDARAYLSAALTNKNTCFEGLDSASGPLKPVLLSSMTSAYEHVSNSLSMLARPGGRGELIHDRHNRRLMGFPGWLSRKSRRILESSSDDYDPGEVLTVAQDGTGNFTTVSDAVNYAPNNSFDRVIILVKQGVYEENVEIPSYKMNIVLIGDGSDVTFITGSRSVAAGWTTFRSATVAVSGEGFLARDITVENTAGAENHQAVALRVNADFAALYRCTFTGFQDTLYVHSFRQFFRECDVYGTVDFIFGNAAVVFQNSNVVSRLPMPGQFTVVTAQSRETPDEDTGMSFQNCSVLAAEDLYAATPSKVKSYLGRPWRVYSRAVFLECYIDEHIDPSGWTPWSGDEGLDTLYYGEYNNYGPGSGTDQRVGWQGFHVMDYSDASNFTVSEFITGYAWLESTSFPYDDGV